jgi:hypothetical protein
MSVVPLIWNDGEGYDIHVMRKGPPSKALDKSFTIDPQFTDPLVFTPHFKGAPSAQGVSVDTTTGAVTASAALAPPLRNFLMTVSQNRGPDAAQTLIRIHLHGSIQKIWLTPATLTIHQGAAECRFTVLALFDDGTVGDITDWPQLTYASADPTIADVSADGTLKVASLATALGRQVVIKATLDKTAMGNLPTPPPASATAITQENWKTLGSLLEPKVSVEFVDGPLRPNYGNRDCTDELNGPDLGGTNKDSFQKVVDGKANILFISEGFTQSQKTDFTTEVEALVKDKTTGLLADILQPFKLLKGSINYWSLFVPSQDDGISVFGDYQITGASPNQTGSAIVLPEEPGSTSTSWSLANMIHQLGLPAPQDPVLSINAAVTQWNQLYDTQVTAQLVSANFADWNGLRSRSPLNERDTLFGFANGMRPRATDTNGSSSLRPALRRTTDASLKDFINSLTICEFNIGQFWDAVCFICLSDSDAGEAVSGFFAATTGLSPQLALNTVANGMDIMTPALSNSKFYDRVRFASKVAHECGHAFGLGDEYGPGNGAFFSGTPAGAVSFPNLHWKGTITSTSGSQTTYNPALIKWALPRVFKVAVMTPGPVDQVLFDQGNNVIQMKLAVGQGRQFNKGDLVVMRQPPVPHDKFRDLRFTVDTSYPDAVDVIQSGGTPTSLPDIKLSYDQTKRHVLICASSTTSKGAEVKLIADKVLGYIAQAGGPLNAPFKNPQAACVPSNNAQDKMQPTLLPKNFLKFAKDPPDMADVLGIYEGGGHFDCGVFRPAGRCKMRRGGKIGIPFCQVCQYIIVDRIDATQLQKWDKQYAPNYPT